MKKRPLSSAPTSVAEFDFAARREFVTGASQRKEQRRKEAEIRALEKRKEERRLLRAERREKIQEHINHVRNSQRLAALAAAKIPVEKRESIAAAKPKDGTSGTTDKAASFQVSALEAAKCKRTALPEARSNDVLQAVRLLPAAIGEVAPSPWLVGSCVSLTVGGFADPQEAATAPSHAPSSHPDARPIKDRTSSSVRRPSTPQVASRGGKRSVGRRRVSRGGQRPQKKRHKSRKPQQKRSGRR